MSTNPVTLGALKNQTNWGDYNGLIFIIQQTISKLQTATLVQVKACTNDGDASPVGTVDVLPLVNQLDGSIPANSTPHVTLFSLPYLRVQGGTNAVIMDPQVGDIGIALFASRDISNVKSTKTQANPGSYRQYDFQDGIYIGGFLNGNPQQYVMFNSSGITVLSPTKITLQAPTIEIDGDVTISQSLAVTDDVTAGEISLMNHLHTSEAPGTPTGPPLP